MAGWVIICMIKVLVLGSVDTSRAVLRPRISFSYGSPDRVTGAYHNFTVKNARTFLLSTDAETLFVGAENVLFSLDVSQPDDIKLKNKLDWAPAEDNLKTCKTASMTDCGNFIQILQFFNSTHLYICGTNAYGPQGMIIQADSLKRGDAMDAKSCCPYSSVQRNTASIVDEELYAATSIGFFRKKHIISRCYSKGTHINLVLDSAQKLLNDPVFISSTHISSEGKVLLFFTETGDLFGDTFADSFTVSRVAQVCTDDNGGERVLQKQWTSFAKSQLVCQQRGELQFNVLQDMIKLSPPDPESPDRTLFYGVFTSQWSGSSGLSAVCAFSLTDITAAFSGDYKTLNMNGNHWSRQSNTDGKLGKCGLFNDSDIVLNIVKKSFLTEKNIRPVGENLLLTSTEERYSRVAAQRTRAANGQIYTVLYLLTESGFLHKVVLLDGGPHIIEEIQVFKPPQFVKNILLSPSKGVVFVGSSEGVFRVPVSNCSTYPNCAECVLARDPFCGWDPETRACTAVSGVTSNLQQDVERGNVSARCTKIRNTATAPAVTRPARLNEIVSLPCQSRSRLAKVTWRFSNGSVVSKFPFQLQPDGSLIFRVTPETVNTYRCVSEELDFQQTLAAFSVTPPARPRSCSSHPDTEPIPDGDITHTHDEIGSKNGKKFNVFNTPDRDGAEDAVCISQKSYYAEMVSFCLLFFMCLCVCVVFVILWWRGKRCNRTSPQNPPKDTETDNIWQTELEENTKSIS